MIYQYTGQPGHGKTLHAIDHAMEFRDKGRLVYVCNVRGFKHADTRMLPLDPEGFKDWESLPDGSVVLVDECYESGMLPRRGPGKPVPRHVEQLAKHRHRGFDFIFVCQSPTKQMDDFVHDLIERHTHVRRIFGLPFARLRIFDRYERNPEKAHPLIIKRVGLPKRPMGSYESTVLETTEKKIPWYMIALPIVLVAVVAGALYMRGRVKDVMGEKTEIPVTNASVAAAHGAVATGGVAPLSPPSGASLRSTDYVAWLKPRVPSQPWTAPAYDSVPVPNKPPRLFCYVTGDGETLKGWEKGGCKCVTDQATRYALDDLTCRTIVRDGQYEPLLQNQPDRPSQGAIERGENHAPVAAVGVGDPEFRGQQARYGQMRNAEIPNDYHGSMMQ